VAHCAGKAIVAMRRKKRSARGPYNEKLMRQDEVMQREAAFAAIKRLYCEALPLWRSCPRGYCRRHQCCIGEAAKCLPRGWPLMPAELQVRAFREVLVGGPQRRPPATPLERRLRRYPPTNFVHR
jgi:hypothetical protein